MGLERQGVIDGGSGVRGPAYWEGEGVLILPRRHGTWILNSVTCLGLSFLNGAAMSGLN